MEGNLVIAEQDVVVVGAARTAIGDYGGSLKDIPPTELGSIAIREAVKRAGVDPNDIGIVVFGNVIHSEPKDMYLSRVAAVGAGIAQHTPAFTLNRLCGSGLQAILTAAQSIKLGDEEVAVAGGAESMSRGVYALESERWGKRMGNGSTVDMVIGAVTDPFDNISMGETAENVAVQLRAPAIATRL